MDNDCLALQDAGCSYLVPVASNLQRAAGCIPAIRSPLSSLATLAHAGRERRSRSRLSIKIHHDHLVPGAQAYEYTVEILLATNALNAAACRPAPPEHGGRTIFKHAIRRDARAPQQSRRPTPPFRTGWLVRVAHRPERRRPSVLHGAIPQSPSVSAPALLRVD